MTWVNPPSNFTKTVSADQERAAKRLALKILRNLVLESPKDTGRFVNNWLVGLGGRKVSTLQGTDPARTKSFQRGSAAIKRYKRWVAIWISNNLPYAQRLNDGWSDQAPANFVQKAIERALK